MCNGAVVSAVAKCGGVPTVQAIHSQRTAAGRKRLFPGNANSNRTMASHLPRAPTNTERPTAAAPSHVGHLLDVSREHFPGLSAITVSLFQRKKTC